MTKPFTRGDNAGNGDFSYRGQSMKIWTPKEKETELFTWAQDWGQRLHADITETDRYFRELRQLLEGKSDRDMIERALNWSVAACFEYAAGRWDRMRRDRQLKEAAALLERRK